MSQQQKKPLVPDYARPDSSQDGPSQRKLLRDILWTASGEITAQVLVPVVIGLVLLVLWMKGCLGSH